MRADTQIGPQRSLERPNRARSRLRSDGHPADTPGRMVLMAESECPIEIPADKGRRNERDSCRVSSADGYPDYRFKQPLRPEFDSFWVSCDARTRGPASGSPLLIRSTNGARSLSPGNCPVCPDSRRDERALNTLSRQLVPYR